MRMGKRRHIRSVALIAMLIAFALGTVCSAEGVDALNIQNVIVDGAGTMELLIYSNNSDLKPNDVQIQLGGNAINADSVTPYKEGTSWIFLVDTAYVATDVGKEPVIKTIQELIKNMGENDNATILTTGDTDKTIDLIQNKDVLNEMIGSARLNKSITNLNATIGAALDFFASGENVRKHAVLVIVSNGDNGNEIGMSVTELKRNVENSTITVYPVAYVSNGASADNLDRYAKIAAVSRGGISIQEQDEWDAESVLSAIVNNEAHFYTVIANPAAVQATGAEVSLYDGEESSTWILSESDQQRLKSFVIKEKEDSLFSWIWIVGGVVLALIVVLCIIIVCFRKAKSKKDDDAPCPDEPSVDVSENDDVPDVPNEEEPHDDTPKQRIQLMFLQVNGGSAQYNVEMTGEEITVGRDPARAGLVIRDDLKISGMHLVLRYDRNMMMVEDFSRNGTKVNGNRIDRPTVLHQHDVLTLGATQLRITWRIKS